VPSTPKLFERISLYIPNRSRSAKVEDVSFQRVGKRLHVNLNLVNPA
jgi:hypothetical protein